MRPTLLMHSDYMMNNCCLLIFHEMFCVVRTACINTMCVQTNASEEIYIQ